MRLTIDINGNDISDDMSTYLRDSADLSLQTGEYLFITLEKYFSKIYVEMETPSTVINSLVVEYYNGSSWSAVTSLIDETKGFTRSGFISWELGETKQLRISTIANMSASSVKGIGLVFSNDLDLEEAFYNIDTLLPQGASSFISYHQAARNEIIQSLRNQGNYTAGGDLTEWDLLQPDQIREASKWKALSLIFTDVSNEVDDKYDQLRKNAVKKYHSAINLYLKSIDYDNDGVLTTAEKFNIVTTMVTRI